METAKKEEVILIWKALQSMEDISQPYSPTINTTALIQIYPQEKESVIPRSETVATMWKLKNIKSRKIIKITAKP